MAIKSRASRTETSRGSAICRRFTWWQPNHEHRERRLPGAQQFAGAYLNGNQITSIENGDFQGLSNLQTLDLGGNQITSLENGDFQGLSNLQTLTWVAIKSRASRTETSRGSAISRA